jgi:hypothetical protein
MAFVITVARGDTRAAYPTHPFEVLIYATKHGYSDLMDVAERRALELSPAEAFGCFSPAVYIAWVIVLQYGVRPVLTNLVFQFRLGTMLNGWMFLMSLMHTCIQGAETSIPAGMTTVTPLCSYYAG